MLSSILRMMGGVWGDPLLRGIPKGVKTLLGFKGGRAGLGRYSKEKRSFYVGVIGGA